MALPRVRDENRAKKDDDYRFRPAAATTFRPSTTWRMPRRRRLLVLAVLAIALLYLLSISLAADRSVYSIHPPPRWPDVEVAPDPFPDVGHPSKEDERLRFPELSKSLSKSRLAGTGRRGVLFAAASLRSVADLLPLACEKTRHSYETVHFAVMGREPVSIEGIQYVNGISSDDCKLVWHDARAEHAASFTDARMVNAVDYALWNLLSTLYVDAVIAHGPALEEDFFIQAIGRRAEKHGVPLVSLPARARDLMWIADLDGRALRAWNHFNVELLIQAPSGSSASLVRLLRSLNRADYLGTTPKLTIELPTRTDPQLLKFIKRLRGGALSPERISLRRRVPLKRMTPLEAAIQTVEAFYPSDPSHSHVLLLSPQAELSPSFYHFLKYAVLKYRESYRSARSKNLLGVSLDLPTVKPTDDTPFTVPDIDAPFFCWQSPNSNAVLYFGDKWAEFHTFMVNLLETSAAKAEPSEKQISTKYPAFMEMLLKFIRTRGYFLLYPSFPARQSISMAVIHEDFYQAPEEFLDEHATSHETEDKAVDFESVKTTLYGASTLANFIRRLPDRLPGLARLPFLAFDGSTTTFEELTEASHEFAKKLNVPNVACSKHAQSRTVGSHYSYNADGLLCVPDR